MTNHWNAMKIPPAYLLTATAIRIRVTHASTEELNSAFVTTTDRIFAKQHTAIPAFAAVYTVAGS